MKPTTVQERAFTTIIENHKKLIFKIANAYCKSTTDREDLTQEIILQLWRAFPKYNPQFALTTWIYRIALNVSISYYRQTSKRKEDSVSDKTYIFQIADTTTIDTPQNEQLQLLQQFINELKELDKAIMLLYLENNKYEEIANILGISKTNVATKISRIKQRLKKRFDDLV